MKEILEYWFPTLEFQKFWFSDIKDEEIKLKYGNILDNISKTETIPNNVDDLLSSIIILDQFTRNIYRNTDKAYQNDIKALKLAEIFFKNKYDLDLTINKLIFALMPFRHSEKIEHQEFVLNKIKLIQSNNILKTESDNNILQKFNRASLKSYNNILKYSKFPHRLI